MTHPGPELADYVDGTLAPSRTARIDEHLRTCATCRAEVDLAIAARDALRERPRARPRPRDWRTPRSRRPRELAAARTPEVRPARPGLAPAAARHTTVVGRRRGRGRDRPRRTDRAEARSAREQRPRPSPPARPRDGATRRRRAVEVQHVDYGTDFLPEFAAAYDSVARAANVGTPAPVAGEAASAGPISTVAGPGRSGEAAPRTPSRRHALSRPGLRQSGRHPDAGDPRSLRGATRIPRRLPPEPRRRSRAQRRPGRGGLGARVRSPRHGTVPAALRRGNRRAFSRMGGCPQMTERATAAQRDRDRLRAGRLHRGPLRRAGRPRAARPEGPRGRRSADADDRRRELPGVRRRDHGPRADGPDGEAGAAVRRRDPGRPRHRGRPVVPSVPGEGGRPGVAGPHPDHRHRRHGALARHPRGGAAAGSRRQRLRHVRRLLLPRSRAGRGRRRGHRDGGGDLPHEVRIEGHDRASTRRVPRLQGHAGSRVRAPEDRGPLGHRRWTRSWATRP